MVEGVEKCPYFHSLSLRWSEISEELTEQIMSILDAYRILDDI